MIEHDPDHPDSTDRWIYDALESLRQGSRDAEIARLRAGFMACLRDGTECEAESACRADEACICALNLELWCNRAAPEDDT